MATTSSNLVFVPDSTYTWLKAESFDIENADGTVTVRIVDEITASSTRTINLKSLPFGMTTLPLQNPNIPDEGVDDMCSLSFLHEPSILDNLIRRFQSCLPYTYTGDICIAVSYFSFIRPFHQLNFISRLFWSWQGEPISMVGNIYDGIKVVTTLPSWSAKLKLIKQKTNFTFSIPESSTRHICATSCHHTFTPHLLLLIEA